MSERVLIFAPNWLGDAVMALPALEAVRQALPRGTIDVAARSGIAPLFTLVPEVGVVDLGRRTSAGSALREGGYKTALLFPNSFNAARVARSAAIPERWGYSSDFRSWLLTKAVPQPTRLHQADYYRHLVRALGFSGGDLPPRLTLSADQRAAGMTQLIEAGWDPRTPLIALAPGAAFGSAKRWPPRSFAAVAERLGAAGVRCVLIGGAAERAAADEVRATCRTTPVLDFTGRTDLPALASILVHTRGLVTNDSGAMHFAAALGLSVTAMFGPTNERETYPLGLQRHTVLTNPVWCRPCMLRECPLVHRCMTGISPDVVFTAARSLV